MGEMNRSERAVDKTETVFVTGKAIDVTSNLLDALNAIDRMNEKQYAKDGYLNLWIDAICINQDDLVERSAQVQLMGSIYASSLAVVAWLGEDTSDAQEFISLHTALGRVIADEDGRKALAACRPFDSEVISAFCDGDNNLWQKVWLSYFRFYDKRRWFQRAWVVQEFALSRNLILLCGHHFLPQWQILLAVDTFLQQSGWENDILDKLPRGSTSSSPGQDLLRTKAAVGDVQLSSALELSESTERSWKTIPALEFTLKTICGATTDEELWHSSLFHWLQLIIGTFASDLRDKVYAIVAMLLTTKATSLGIPILSVQDV